MRRPFFSSLRFRLLALVFLAVIPAAGLILYSGLDRRADARDQVKADILASTEVTAAQHEQLVEGSRQLGAAIAALASGIDFADVDTEACRFILAGLLQIRDFDPAAMAALA